MAMALLAVGVCAGLLWCGQQSAPLAAAEEPAPACAEVQAMVIVNINEADWAELSLVPGLGKALSRKIVARRETKGPYRSVDELLEINGIGAPKLAALRPYLTVGGAPPAGGRRDEERQGHVGLSTGQ
jgi:DNA uptake protein ComE-like DNA-binding protein